MVFVFAGQTALHCAIRNHGKPKEDGVGIINSIPIIEFLIKSGADPSAQVCQILNHLAFLLLFFLLLSFFFSFGVGAKIYTVDYV